jgi:AraC family transcriptional regulator
MSSRSWTNLQGPPAGGDRVHHSLDDVVFSTASITIGAFRCPTWHPSFRDSGPIQNDVFVFPRRAVALCHEGDRPFVADPGVVTLYNRGQRYVRSAVSPAGDQCEWFAIDRELLLAEVTLHDPAIRDRPFAPFRFAYGPCEPRTYLAQRRLFQALRAGQAIDPLRVEETGVALLSAVLSTVYQFWGAPRRAPGVSASQLEAAEHVRRLLSERLGDSLRLADLAREVGLSVFHLCRTFRAATGSSLHAYRNQVRLHEALDRLEGGGDLTQMGLDLGYSSHSHFTAAFRELFGAPPSRVRDVLQQSPARRTRG